MGFPSPIRLAHPCVKPISLTRYLARLIMPPTEIGERRLLVPFSGSGSEMIGGVLAGWDYVLGLEMESEYVEIAEARLKYWQRHREAYKGGVAGQLTKVTADSGDVNQLGLFDEAA